MHLFLYQANRHSPTTTSPYSYTYRTNRSRYKQGTIRGDFDLELLKKGIKGRYKILPHGEHEFQKALVKLELQEEFYGHVIQIEEASNAVWFKLNYDRIGKNVTKYIGSWRDLDPKAIEPYVEEYSTLVLRRRTIQSRISSLNAHMYALTQFNSRLGNDHSEFEPLCESNRQGTALAKGYVTSLSKEVETITRKTIQIQQNVKDYIKERKF